MTRLQVRARKRNLTRKKKPVFNGKGPYAYPAFKEAWEYPEIQMTAFKYSDHQKLHLAMAGEPHKLVKGQSVTGYQLELGRWYPGVLELLQERLSPHLIDLSKATKSLSALAVQASPSGFVPLFQDPSALFKADL